MSEELTVKSIKKPAKNAGLIIMPKVPRLNLQPVHDRIFISSPDVGNTETMVEGIHLPGNSSMMNPYAEVTVEAIGPDVKSVSKGDRVLIVRPQCNKIVHRGNEYFFTTEVAVMDYPVNFSPPYAEMLWTPAVRMTEEDRAMHLHTFEELHKLNAELGGAGIAFPQVGLHMAALVSRYEGWPTCINPEYRIVGQSFISKPERCLSYPGSVYFVRRPEKVYAQWHDVDGFRKTALLEGIEARVFQHLHDLLQGKPIFPRPKAPAHAPVV